jgi:A/G-specific adenine glycosylase
VETLQRKLLGWYAAFRRDLPWRRTRDPWAIWVSEIMLQQTRVETVIPYFERFLKRFPTPRALAEAPEDQVLAAWSGLGYYRRARMLHAGAKSVGTAEIPNQREGLLELPGVGRYTAGAIASIAFGRAVGLVDGNVARVLARIFAIEDDMKKAGMKKAEALADRIVAAEAPGEWNQALMELGATICTPRNPACDRCPLASECRALGEGKVERLPVLGEKAKPKPQKLRALVARKSEQVLLLRRRSEGLFGGLWEPPMLEPDVFDRFTADAELAKAGRVVHVLSHRKLTIDVFTSTIAKVPKTLPEPYEAAGLFDSPALEELGISTLARKVLALASPLRSGVSRDKTGAR